MEYLIIFLVLSIMINVVLVRYSILSARKLLIVANNIDSFRGELESLERHLEIIHESEMYYGDQALQGLVTHTKDMLLEFEKYEDIYTLVLEEEDYEQEEQIDNNENRAAEAAQEEN